MKRILSLVLVCALALTIVASASAESVVLRMATGYNNAKTGLFFDASIAGEGITLADGVTYNTGDLKPTWVEMQKILSEKTGNDVKFENKYQGNGAAAEFEYWKAQLDQVDMVTGTAATLTEYGVAGNLINLADHMDKLPNFKAYMDANPIVRLSITGDTKTGAIYFAPYFDGVNDIEKMLAALHTPACPGKPRLILMHTLKGKGVSFMEGQVGWHGKAPNDEQTAIALKDLEG